MPCISMYSTCFAINRRSAQILYRDFEELELHVAYALPVSGACQAADYWTGVCKLSQIFRYAFSKETVRGKYVKGFIITQATVILPFV